MNTSTHFYIAPNAQNKRSRRRDRWSAIAALPRVIEPAESVSHIGFVTAVHDKMCIDATLNGTIVAVIFLVPFHENLYIVVALFCLLSHHEHC